MVSVCSGSHWAAAWSWLILVLLLVATPCAQFAHAEVIIGQLSGADGTQQLQRSIGRSRALDMMPTVRTVDAKEALRFGLLNLVLQAFWRMSMPSLLRSCH
ncbi:enoyl-CoA hydratase-related protein [Burkholderia sp. SCN-KJ]|uniref:enoyl-CoA hydratase-related protein n=1 Tax=unclassified Burkholderia TaxID=2613784 RepID=UPI0035AF1D0F